MSCSANWSSVFQELLWEVKNWWSACWTAGRAEPGISYASSEPLIRVAKNATRAVWGGPISPSRSEDDGRVRTLRIVTACQLSALSCVRPRVDRGSYHEGCHTIVTAPSLRGFHRITMEVSERSFFIKISLASYLATWSPNPFILFI